MGPQQQEKIIFVPGFFISVRGIYFGSVVGIFWLVQINFQQVWGLQKLCAEQAKDYHRAKGH